MIPDRTFTKVHGFTASEPSGTQQQNVGSSRSESFGSGYDSARDPGDPSALVHDAYLQAGRTISWGNPQGTGNPHDYQPEGNNPYHGDRESSEQL